jgi:hypothetical protein
VERILTNDFSWSKSRDEKFRECLRAYYLHYYRSWGGWEADAPDEIRRLYVLKKLGNRYNWAGSVVHQAIRHSLLGIRFGRPIDPARVIDRAHRLMRQDYVYSVRKGYWSEPYRRQFRGLVEHEYAEQIAREEWKRNWENAKAALCWFFESRWVPLARSLRPEQWLEIDSAVFERSNFLLDSVKVFAVPDFAYLGEDGAPVVVDWKTGGVREGHGDQVLGYALYIASRYNFPAEAVKACVVFLNSGVEETVKVDAQSLSTFQSRFRRSVEAMKQLTLEASANSPRPEEEFPMTGDLALCARCVFRRPCGRERAVARAA